MDGRSRSVQKKQGMDLVVRCSTSVKGSPAHVRETDAFLQLSGEDGAPHSAAINKLSLRGDMLVCVRACVRTNLV